MQNKTYILLKDLPDAKAGTELIFDGDHTYDYKSHRTNVGDNETVSWYRMEFVENNPEWFKLKEEPKEGIRLIGVSIKGNVLEYENSAAIKIEKNKITSIAIDGEVFLPELKEEPKHDWEVVSVKKYNNRIPTVTITEKRDLEVFVRDYEDWTQWGFVIHSVRRVSDGEILIAGEGNYGNVERTDGYPNKPIKKFFIKEGVMYAQFDEGKGSNDGCLGINSIRKNKEVLFTTEDGKPVYMGETYWKVTPMEGCWKADETVMREMLVPPPIYFKYFSTIEAANEFILMNKPCLSIKDIISMILETENGRQEDGGIIGVNWLKNRLEKLANKKINNK